MQLVTVFTAFNPAEAQLIRSRLEAAGILAFVADELAALSMDGYALAAGGIRVQVPEVDAAAALELIRDDGGEE
ncbi:MAG: putative prokaryotic signal transducing protein [Verrucomicrobiota bacterium]